VFRRGWLLVLAAFLPEVLLALFLTVLNAPEPRVGRSSSEVVVVSLSNLVIGVPVAIYASRFVRRMFDSATLWLVEEREPTTAERVAVLRIPASAAFVGFVSWMLSLMGLLALSSWRLYAVGHQTLRIASGYLLCGIGAWMMGTLMAEKALRPIWSTILEHHPDEVPSTLSVQWRILLSWGVGASLPLAVLAFAPQSLGLSAAGWVVLIVGLVAGLVLMVLTATSLTGPLNRLRLALAQVQQGDLHVQIPIEDSGEVGQLEAGFNRMVDGLGERQRLEDLFGRHVGVDVARRALDRGVELGGEKCEASALFVDLIGSTTIAQSADPDEVVGMLNDFFAAVVSITHAEGGWINKFQGDAALCVFGPPTHCVDHRARALRAARRLREALCLDAGIGISSGLVVAGNVGAHDRFEYTVIGDAVNEAARLSEVAKRLPERVIASAAVVRAAGPDAVGSGASPKRGSRA
jgi:adenylate cyclase